MKSDTYDCVIVGGGVSGLSLAIQLADSGFSVVVFEKNVYPFHKVCGEYISMESWDFLVRLGLPLSDMNLPIIDQLGISSQSGFMLHHTLKMGGFGISRYTLDEQLSRLAVQRGVTLITNCRVNGIADTENGIREINTTNGSFGARIVCGSYGKYTPGFLQENQTRKAKDSLNYIGVKYHIKVDLPDNRIELHNFEDGYCGISKVDNDWHCLCYLTTAANLQKHGKDIKTMEENVLYKNPFLKKYFTQSAFVYEQPHIISNVSFGKKQTDIQDTLLLGDAAGTITPLCGNGMSMGMRASKILAAELTAVLRNQQTVGEAKENYSQAWHRAFGARIKAGYYLQSIFGKSKATHLALKLLSSIPIVTDKLVALTHGDRF